jgi:hypothetical protein
LTLGALLFLAIALLSSCREDSPPVIEICIGDGLGGADCILKDGSKIWRSPTDLQNYWMTNQVDMGEFSAWCYQTDKIELVQKKLGEIAQKTK